MSGLLLKYLHLTTDENNALPPGDAKRACSVIAIPPLNEVRFDGYNLIEVLDDGKIVFKTQITGNAYLMTEAGKTINTFTPSVFERANLVELHDTQFLKLNAPMEKINEWAQSIELSTALDRATTHSFKENGKLNIYREGMRNIRLSGDIFIYTTPAGDYNIGNTLECSATDNKRFTIRTSDWYTFSRLIETNTIPDPDRGKDVHIFAVIVDSYTEATFKDKQRMFDPAPEPLNQLDMLNHGKIQDCSLRPAGDSFIYPDFFKDIYVHNKEIRFHYLGRIYKLGEKVKVLVDQKTSFTFDADTIQHLWTINGLKNVMDPDTKVTYDVKSIVAPYAIDQGEMKDFVTGKCEEKGAHFNFILNEGRQALTVTDCFRFPGVELADSSVKIITDAEDKIMTPSEFDKLIKLHLITPDLNYCSGNGSKTKIHALLFRTED